MQRTDEVIKKEIVDELFWDVRLDASRVTVEVGDGVVTIRGEAPTYFAKTDGEVTLGGTVPSVWASRSATDIADRTAGVVRVRNDLRVHTASRALRGTR